MNPVHHRPTGLGLRSRNTGLSIIELMVGITLGIFLVGGALTILTTSISSSRTMLIEARLNQDMRATADIIARDLRRSGYWANADQDGTFIADSATSTTSNPYTTITCTTCGTTASQIEYNYSKDSSENNTIDASTEKFGFKVLNGVVYMLTNGQSNDWQPMTDGNVLKITALNIVENSTSIQVSAACALTPTSPPTITIRRYDITLTGQAVSDSTMVRTLQSSVRIRNDLVTGSCPT